MLGSVDERDQEVERARELLRQEAPQQPAQLTRLMTKLLDDAAGVPGTNIRFGIDPLLSIVPGAGSTVGTVFGAVMLTDAIRLRMPIPVLARMGANYLVDWLIGLVPGLGWLGDIAWRANRRNLSLLNRTIADREQVRDASLRYWVAAGAILAGLLLLVVATTVWFVVWLAGMLG
jgi:hypothetical protein